MTITLRSVKGSALTHGELDGNFTDLQTQLDNAAIAYDPVTITGNTTLTAVDHANRLLICNSASPITLTLQSDALGGFDKDDSINAIQIGAGNVTIARGTATTLGSPTGALATTTETYGLIGTVRIGANAHALTESAGGGGGASGTGETSAMTMRKAIVASGQTSTDLQYAGVRGNNQQFHDSCTYSAFIDAAGPLAPYNLVNFRTAAAAAGRLSGTFNNTIYMRRDFTAPINGGFPCTILAGIGDASPTLGTAFLGLIAMSGIGSNIVLTPSSMTNILGVGFDASDANWSIFHNDGTGAATKIDLGVGFVRAQNFPLCVTITKNNDGSVCKIKVVNTRTNASVTSADITTDLPVASNHLTPTVLRGTGASVFTGDLLFGSIHTGAF